MEGYSNKDQLNYVLKAIDEKGLHPIYGVDVFPISVGYKYVKPNELDITRISRIHISQWIEHLQKTKLIENAYYWIKEKPVLQKANGRGWVNGLSDEDKLIEQNFQIAKYQGNGFFLTFDGCEFLKEELAEINYNAINEPISSI